ncbi:hypothetical protein SUGI_0239440 [Cryptomeria japonica]|uniref:ankyrin repeat-containing protein ITN1 n=1 Tax=Cryptomeria japonica TaxID=3369 RepID=UPI002408C95F|nr:ankyrin repeat-containing protein ITN1 [Cryptomeria japonica]GLJ14762.1 hypothetical protein SUGI_0239440 [Cryptomeria japonica]
MKKDLFDAWESGDVETIKKLCKENSHVLCDVTFQGDTPLHIAARKGHLESVKTILSKKPSLAGARNEDNNQPLHEAAKCGNPDLVETLLQCKKSAVCHYNNFGETALIIASKYGHMQVVEKLLNSKLCKDRIEWKVSVKEAAYRGYKDVVEALLNDPIKITQFNKFRDRAVGFPSFAFGTPILHRAVQGGHLEIVKAILNNSYWKDDLMTEKDEHRRCAIHVAAMEGRWDIINEFLSRMPRCVEIRNSEHRSVLHIAVEYNKFEVVHNLLVNKEAETVRELVSRDHDNSRNTALHLAAINKVDSQLLECLLSPPGVDVNALNLDVNALNDEDMTALDIASAAHEHDPIIEKLEAAGATRCSLVQKTHTTSKTKQGSAKDATDIHVIVASLIATVTFAAIFQIPGGIEDDKHSIQYGGARLAFHKVFKLFLFFDTAAFSTSLVFVGLWLNREEGQPTNF